MAKLTAKPSDFTKKLGPLQVWVWLLIVAAVFLLYEFVYKTNANNIAAASSGLQANPLLNMMGQNAQTQTPTMQETINGRKYTLSQNGTVLSRIGGQIHPANIQVNPGGPKLA